MVPVCVTLTFSAPPECGRTRLGVAGVARTCEAEVGDANATIGSDQHVVGLEVAMDEAGDVRCMKAATRLRVDVEHLGDRPLRAALPVAQRLALDELHRDEHLVVDRADVDADDVRVRELCQRLCLAHEPGATGQLDRLGTHDFDRDLAIELGIVRNVDGAHRTAAEP